MYGRRDEDHKLPGVGLNTPDVSLAVMGVTHRYHQTGSDVEVLRNINFEVRRHEFVSLLGPSGCGKSTVLNLLAGFFPPSEGTIHHEGRLVTGPSRTRGVVFQGDAVFTWLTVKDNVAFSLKSRRVAKSEWEPLVDRYIRLVGLEGAEHLFPKHLSGGMRKRVDVARAFASGPDLLLMDESFGSLDSQTKEKLQLDLLDLCEREHKTVVFVTHDIEEALFLADRVIVMSRNPGQVHSVVQVPFPRPRDPDLRVGTRMQQLRAEIHDLLADL